MVGAWTNFWVEAFPNWGLCALQNVTFYFLPRAEMMKGLGGD